MKTIIFLFILLLLTGVGIVLTQQSPITTLFNWNKPTNVVIGTHTFSVTVAKSEKEKEIGLSEKTTLGNDAGMLFVFDKPDYYSFWMQNMKFPLDIIFIRDKKIITIISNAPVATNTSTPALYKPEEPIDTVLEISAGLAQKYKFAKNDTVSFSL